MHRLQATHELRGLNVEVQNITMLCQSLKQYKRLKSRKEFGLSIKKGEGPNLLRVNRKGPKLMNGQALDLVKQREEEVQPSPQGKKIAGELREKTRPGYLGIPRGLGSSRCTVRLG